MKTALKLLKREWRHYREEVAEAQFHATHEGYQYPRTVGVWWVFAATVRVAGSLLVCRWRGHDVVDAGSYGNPEHAADHHMCTRCGQHWSHQYY